MCVHVEYCVDAELLKTEACLAMSMTTGNAEYKMLKMLLMQMLTSTAVQAYPHKQNFCGVFLFSIQKERVQGGFAVLGSPPLPQAVLDPQRVTHVQVLDQLLGSRFVNCLKKLLPVLPNFL